MTNELERFKAGVHNGIQALRTGELTRSEFGQYVCSQIYMIRPHQFDEVMSWLYEVTAPPPATDGVSYKPHAKQCCCHRCLGITR